MRNYINKIRSKLGSDKFIHPGARIIVENDNKEILVIERRDNGRIGIPAGSIEENETIEDCIRREVQEETGLKLLDLEVIGISSNPDVETVRYANGDCIQYFTIEFYSESWEGQIMVNDAKEIKAARFVDIGMIEDLPKNELSTFDSLHYFRKYNRILIK